MSSSMHETLNEVAPTIFRSLLHTRFCDFFGARVCEARSSACDGERQYARMIGYSRAGRASLDSALASKSSEVAMSLQQHADQTFHNVQQFLCAIPAKMANKRKLNEHDVPEETSPQSAKRRASDASENAESTTSSKTITAPAASFAEFELEPRLLRGIRDQKWSSPTAVQSKAIPLALQGRDILARSGTGTGKTAAYLLPVLHNAPRRKGTTSLILVPTKELALQITKVAKALSTHCGQEIRIQNIAGKESEVVTKAKLADKPEIVIATPARASANINNGALSVAELAHLVVDEGDLVMGYGFKEDLDQIAQNIPKGVQIFLMSATLNTEVE